MSHDAETGGNNGRNVLARTKAVLELVALVAIIAVCGEMVWRMWGPGGVIGVNHPPTRTATGPTRAPETRVPTEPIALTGAQLLGSRTATVATLEYGDPQCPFCGRFAQDTLPALRAAYIETGKMVLAYESFPLEAIHPFAMRAAEAEACAADQGAFWKMHDLTLADQRHLDDATLRTHATAAGVQIKPFEACLAGDVASRVRAGAKTGTALAVSGTPTFFIGVLQADGRLRVITRLAGALPLAKFQTAIDAALAAASARHGRP